MPGLAGQPSAAPSKEGRFGGQAGVESRTVIRRALLPTLLLSLTLATSLSAQRSEESRRILLNAATNGSAAAQYSLGVSAETDGAWDAAVNWYKLAAANGYAGAQYRLGLMLESGRGTQQDLGEAKRWFRQAANANFAPAIERLAALDPNPGSHSDASPTTPRYAEATTHWYSGLLDGASTALTIVLLLAAAYGLYWLFGRLEASARASRTTSASRSSRSRR